MKDKTGSVIFLTVSQGLSAFGHQRRPAHWIDVLHLSGARWDQPELRRHARLWLFEERRALHAYGRSKNGVLCTPMGRHPVRRSSSDLAADVLEYWIRAFAGMTLRV